MKVIVYLLGLTTIATRSFFFLYPRETSNASKTFLKPQISPGSDRSNHGTDKTRHHSTGL
jgi:hypothetical protein